MVFRDAQGPKKGAKIQPTETKRKNDHLARNKDNQNPPKGSKRQKGFLSRNIRPQIENDYSNTQKRINKLSNPISN
jgi:hypothetical protein